MVMKLTTAIFVVSLVLTGCATNPDGSVNQNQRAQIGGVVGAIGGAVIGKQVGGDKGAIGGALLGGGLGAFVGNDMDKQARKLQQDLANQQVEVARVNDTTIRLTFEGDVTFDTGSVVLKPRFRSSLDNVVASAREYNTGRIQIVGHTDNVGDARQNQRLSERRATSVANYMSDRGVQYNRITAVGRGETQPVADNSSSYGRGQNRRVEVFLIN